MSIVEFAELFCDENDVFVGYPAKELIGIENAQIIFLNEVRVTKKRLGEIAFAYSQGMGDLHKNRASLCKDLAKQIVFEASKRQGR